jgi:hypothetical protein
MLELRARFMTRKLIKKDLGTGDGLWNTGECPASQNQAPKIKKALSSKFILKNSTLRL